MLSSDFPPVHGGASQYHYSYLRHVAPGAFRIIAGHETGWREFDAAFRHPVRRWDFFRHTSFASKFVKIAEFGASTLAAIPAGIAHIHCGQILSTGAVGWLCNRLYGIPYTLYVHGAEELEEFQIFEVMGRYRKLGWINEMMRRFLRDADRIVCSSPWPHARMLEYGIDPDRLVTFLPVVEPTEFDAAPAQVDALRAAHGLTGRRVLMTVSRLSEHKGQDVTMRALPAILARYPDAVYVIAGKGPDEARLHALRDELGLGEAVRFLGHVSDADRKLLYRACDVFVMASREIHEKGLVEGFGISFLEAGLCEKPVIAGRSGGIPGGVVNGVELPGSVLHETTGLLVDPEQPADIAAAALRLLDRPEEAARMGAAGRERVLREFTRDSLVRAWCELYGLPYVPETSGRA